MLRFVHQVVARQFVTRLLYARRTLSVSILEEETDDSYFHQRKQEIELLGTTAYPDNFKPNLTLSDFIAKYRGIPNGARVQQDQGIRVAGRIVSKREASKKLTFYDISQGQDKLQVLASVASFQDQEGAAKLGPVLQRGDIIGVEGFPGKSQTGELSIIPHSITLLSPCLRPVPLELQNPEVHVGGSAQVRHSQRYLDLMVNPSSYELAVQRARILKFLRRFFESRGFLEVETPLLQRTAGGATARPFVTEQIAGHIPLFLRIAPELFLKQLIIGGMPKVFELGKQFRNEGTDRTHNPEFTTLEAYAAYHDYEDMMKLTEQMFQELWQDTLGLPQLQINGVTYPRHFPRLPFLPTIEREAGEPLKGFELDEMIDFARRHKVHLKPPHTPARVLDDLASHFIEPLCVGPTFITDHPRILSPLAKPHPDNPNLVQRFELFVGGVEYVNAYTELNDPAVQRENFQEQLAAKAAGDHEAQSADLDFCTALEYGLPPTAGWGIGVDRLVMLLLNQSSIREVLLFPLTKTKTKIDQD